MRCPMGFVVAKEPSRRGLVDDRHRRRSRAVPIREQAAVDGRYSQRFEIAAAGRLEHGHHRRTVRRRQRIAFFDDRRFRCAPFEWDRGVQPDRLDPRRVAETREQVLVERNPGLGRRIAGIGEAHAHRHHPGRREAKVDIGQAHDALDQESGADEQHGRQRDLRRRPEDGGSACRPAPAPCECRAALSGRRVGTPAMPATLRRSAPSSRTPRSRTPARASPHRSSRCAESSTGWSRQTLGPRGSRDRRR